MDAMTDAKECIKNILHDIETMLPKTENDFIDEIKERIRKLEEIHKEKFSVGVLGVTGAGKSSLVNAVLGRKRLLPSGTIGACTSVIIELTANMENSNYEAEIEFIPKDQWVKELKELCEMITHPGDADREIVAMAKSKIQALYGNGAADKDFNTLTAMENFSDIFANGKKIISHEDVAGFSKAFDLYICSKEKHTRNRPKDETYYWPLVKLVTIKVPNAEDLLENIVLVDVPGTGDWNKARDEMWEKYISKLSSVWVVADIDRAVSDIAAWRILGKISDNLGPGGQCNSATFICTKTDNISSDYKEDEELPIDGQFVGAKEGDVRKRACILDRNKKATEAVEVFVSDQYKNLGSIKVFTVSSEEFQKTIQPKILKPEETEIPNLSALLKELNDQQSNELTKRYVSEVFDIISTIHVINSEEIEKNEKKKSELKSHVTSCLKQKLKEIIDFLINIKEEFDRTLTKAATTSKEECVAKAWKEVLDIDNKPTGYHNTLIAVCRGHGVSKSKEDPDLNAILTETMKDAIIRRFEEVFPNNKSGNEKSINCQIDKFNILSENLQKRLSTQYFDLIKLKQENVIPSLEKDIIFKKSQIYQELITSVKTSMEPAYEKAASVNGKGCTKKKRDILWQHIEKEKDTMFSMAKDSMLEGLERLGSHIIKILHDELLRALMEPLETQKNKLPDWNVADVSQYYKKMKWHYNQLTRHPAATVDQHVVC